MIELLIFKNEWKKIYLMCGYLSIWMFDALISLGDFILDIWDAWHNISIWWANSRSMTRQLLKIRFIQHFIQTHYDRNIKKFCEFQTQFRWLSWQWCVCIFHSFPKFLLFDRMQNGILIKYAKRLVLLGN